MEEERGSDEAGQQSGGGSVPSTGGDQATVVVGQSSPAAGTLPFTGTESLILALLGLMTLGLGLGLRRVVRTRA